MSRVQQKHTSPERTFRAALHRKGLRFRLHRRIEGVAVDIVFPSAGLAVFIDGCFWHGCPEHATLPKTNQEYWLPKLADNKRRDRTQTAKLQATGWRVVRIWEHDCSPPAADAVERIVEACRAGADP